MKADLLELIKRTTKLIPLNKCLEIINLSAARYHSWVKRAVSCRLADEPSCPRISPSRLTSSEIEKIKEMSTDKSFSHFSTWSLSWFAKRSGEVCASPSTWSRVIRLYKLNRKQTRVYPAKPKVGIRASKPGQIWHLDLSVIKLTDGTRCYVQAIIDNFSRYVLAWKVAKDYGGLKTKELLISAINTSNELGIPTTPEVYVDNGSENINSHINSLIASNVIERTIAQTEVDFSNSMIEMLFHRLKNRHLYNIPLQSIEKLDKRDKILHG